MNLRGVSCILRAGRLRSSIEMARRHLTDGCLVLYDITSTCFEGERVLTPTLAANHLPINGVQLFALSVPQVVFQNVTPGVLTVDCHQ